MIGKKDDGLERALATEDDALRLLLLARGAFRRAWLLETHTQSASAADAERIAATAESLDGWRREAERLFPSVHERVARAALAEPAVQLRAHHGTGVEVALDAAADVRFGVIRALAGAIEPTGEENIGDLRALQAAEVQPPPTLPAALPVEVIERRADLLTAGWRTRERIGEGETAYLEDQLERLRLRLDQDDGTRGAGERAAASGNAGDEGPAGYMGLADLAEALGVPAENRDRLRSRLNRLRDSNRSAADLFIEAEDSSAGQRRLLWNHDRIRQLLDLSRLT